MAATEMTLEQQRANYSNRRFLAMPLAGLIMWTGVGIASQFLSGGMLVLATYLLVGNTFYLGAFLSTLTGEHFFRKNKPKNMFDGLFMSSIAMALLVFAIAIPFSIEVPHSLPLSLGIMTSLMWITHSWIIQHWIGYVHCAFRTVLIVAVWFLFPEQAFLYISIIVVVAYIFSIAVMETRWNKMQLKLKTAVQ